MDEQKKSVLKERAKRLAYKGDDELISKVLYEIIKFKLSDEHYAFEIGFIKEVMSIKEITPLKIHGADFIVGIINLRGQILSVVDIRKFYGIPTKGIAELGYLLVLKFNGNEVGVLADKVEGIYGVSEDELQDSFYGLEGIQKDFLKGVTSDRTAILEAQKLLTDKKLIINQK